MSDRPDPLPRLLARFPGIALELDHEDCILTANDAARECAGTARHFPDLLDNASREKWRQLTRDDERHATAELLLECALHEGPRTFFISPHRDGRRLLIEIPCDPEIARLHDELTALNSDLVNAQRRIAKQSDEVRRVMHARERFFSAMSHELRTPLTGILGYGHLLIDGIAGELQPQQREFIERMGAAALHLNSLIDDILDLAKLESGTLELDLEQTIIADVTDDVVATIGPSARAAGSPLLTDLDHAPDFITSDPRALRQILLNLMSNAIKFGAGEPVLLKCTRIGDQVRFEVADRGVGVAPEDAERIFDEFGQGQAGRQQKGTGLGLSISRQLAERLGGRLWLKAGEEKGAVFVLDLPVTGPPEG